jgi:hypothetical protein
VHVHIDWTADEDPDSWVVRLKNDGPEFEMADGIGGDSRGWDFVATWESCGGGNEVSATVEAVVGAITGPPVESQIVLGNLST